METLMTVIALTTIILIAIISLKNRHKRNGRPTIVSLIMLSSSSVLIALVLKSMFSLIFFALQLILLVMALGFAINAAKAEGVKKG